MRVTCKTSELKKDAPRMPFNFKAKFPSEDVVKPHPILKTLVSDIEALCNPRLWPALKVHEIIYVSSAPPRYMGILASLFPNNKFWLYHTHMEQKEIEKLPRNVEWVAPFLDDKAAEAWELYSSGTDLFLICNWRSQEGVESTMMKQMKWIEDIGPINWSVDLGWNYKEDNFFYLPGQLRISPFGKIKSPELRLDGTDRKKPVVYDYKKIREQMCYHNMVVRAQPELFAGDYKDPRIDHGYDWSVFMHAMRLYLETQQPLHRPRKDSEVLSFAREILRLAK